MKRGGIILKSHRINVRRLLLINGGVALALLCANPVMADQKPSNAGSATPTTQAVSEDQSSAARLAVGQSQAAGTIADDQTVVSSAASAVAGTTSPNDQTGQASTGSNQVVTSQPLQNDAWLDSCTYGQGQITVAGWHATTAATTQPTHYLILLANGREVGRQVVQNTARPDVAKVYPSIPNAGNSGWQAHFTLTPAMLDENLQLVSRYTSSSDGNSDYTDYWFTLPQVKHSTANDGWLDAVNLSDGNLRVSGWHANDFSIAAPNRFLIVYDQTAQRQVTATKIESVQRTDVAKVYPAITTASESGFSANFGQVKLDPTHRYSLVSRYSTSAYGNGGDGDYRDYWFDLGNLKQSASYIDSFKRVGDHIHVSGWLASNYQMIKPYAYLIVLNNGKEVGRTQLSFYARPDVAKVYPGIYQSANSGFSLDLPAKWDQLMGNLTLVLRFTDDPAGNGNFSDQTKQYGTDVGWYDAVQVQGHSLLISGWHATIDAAKYPVHFLIIEGPSGTVLYQAQLTGNQTNLTRNDVAKAYPYLTNASRSGFSTTVPITLGINHANVRIISRYATSAEDVNNPDDYVDYVSDPVPVNVWSNGYWQSSVSGDREAYIYNGQALTGKQLIAGYQYSFDQSGRLTGFAQRLTDWFRSRKGKLTYSMWGSRNGSDGTADCSGALTQAIQDAGGTKYQALYDTDTIQPYLLANGYYVASSGWQYQPVQYGDIVIWGVPGHSQGAAGHAVLVTTHGQNPDCISAQWGVGRGAKGMAVYEAPYYQYWIQHGRMYATVYRMIDPGKE